MSILALIRSHLVALKPYSSARDEFKGNEGIFLDANENPFGSVTNKKYNRYPDPHQTEAKIKLSKIKGVKPDQIFLGNGSDEAIDLIIKLFCEPKKDNIVILPPTYGMYKVCADIQQVEVNEASLTQDFQIDFEKLETSVNGKTKIIWICSPNNPSGNNINKDDIEQVLKLYPNKIIVIDEAYIDFSSQPSYLSKIDKHPNLIVLQTFSKAWGMAGLRIGVAYSNDLTISYLDKIKYPYNLNILTQNELLSALDNAIEVPMIVKKLNQNREWLKKELLKLSNVNKVFPSDSNQLLVKFNEADSLFDKLINELVIIRNRTKIQRCDDCLRISIGTKEELEKLIETIKKVA